MPLINMFESTFSGAMVLTGNTLQIRESNPYPPAAVDYFTGAYISTNTSLVAAPSYPNGTTFLASENSSTAVLNMPPNSTVKYAELFWITRFSGGSATVQTVTFSTPIGTNIVTCNTILNQTNSIYFRTASVTTIVNQAGPGIYTVSAVPGSTISSSNPYSCSWQLIVVYENQSLPVRYFNVNTGLAAVSASTPSDFSFDIMTPSSGAIKGYFFASESNGDLDDGANIFIGDTLANAIKVGNTSTGTWNGVTPYAQIDNMFPGNILIADGNDSNTGLLDTRGSFGNFNKNPFNKTAPAFARNITDILGIDISNTLYNNQSNIFTRISYTGGAGVLSSQSVQIDITSAKLTPITKTVNKELSGLNETLVYTTTIVNTGLLDAEDIIFIDTLPSEVTFIPNSVYINGVNTPSLTPSSPGITLPKMKYLDLSTVTFSVQIKDTISPNYPILNKSFISYSYKPSLMLPTEYVTIESNLAKTLIDLPPLDIKKSVDYVLSPLNNTISYTILVNNTSSATISNIKLIDTLPTDVLFIPSSLKENNNLISGSLTNLSLTTIPPNSTSTIVYQIFVSTLPQNPILNSSYVEFSYVADQTTTPNTIFTKGSNSNIVTTTLVYINFSTFTKSTNKTFAYTGDTITYTIVIENTGNTQAINTLFKDTLPIGTTFLPNSVKINGISYPGASPSSGIYLNTISANTVLTIEFDITIN